LPTLKSKIIGVINLTDKNNKPQLEQVENLMTIRLDGTKQDTTDTIIELKLDGKAADEMTDNKLIEVGQIRRKFDNAQLKYITAI
jgi:hypothetical protein